MTLDVDITTFLTGIKLQEVTGYSLSFFVSHSHLPQYAKPLLDHGITTASGLIGVSSGALAGYGLQAGHVRQILRIITILSGKVPEADVVHETAPPPPSLVDE